MRLCITQSDVNCAKRKKKKKERKEKETQEKKMKEKETSLRFCSAARRWGKTISQNHELIFQLNREIRNLILQNDFSFIFFFL